MSRRSNYLNEPDRKQAAALLRIRLLRDLLIGVKPVNWINDNIALILVFAGTTFTFLLKEKDAINDDKIATGKLH